MFRRDRADNGTRWIFSEPLDAEAGTQLFHLQLRPALSPVEQRVLDTAMLRPQGTCCDRAAMPNVSAQPAKACFSPIHAWGEVVFVALARDLDPRVVLRFQVMDGPGTLPCNTPAPPEFAVRNGRRSP
jgi:hypothetical protein